MGSCVHLGIRRGRGVKGGAASLGGGTEAGEVVGGVTPPRTHAL